MTRLSPSRVFWTITTALVFASSSAQEPTTSRSDDSTAERSTAMQSRSLNVAETSEHELLLGVDANGDGIRDDLTELLSTQPVPLPSEPSPSAVQSELSTALNSNRPARSMTTRSGCFEYLLMEPKQRAAADRYVQSRTHGVFGTHPCDPVVSPLLERPFETDQARLQLGPVQLNYANYE